MASSTLPHEAGAHPGLASLMGTAFPDWSMFTKTPLSFSTQLTTLVPRVIECLTQWAETSEETPDRAVIKVELTSQLHTVLYDAQKHQQRFDEFLDAVEAQVGNQKDTLTKENLALQTHLEDAKAAQRLAEVTHEQDIHRLQTQLRDQQDFASCQSERVGALEKEVATATQRSTDLHQQLHERSCRIGDLEGQVDTLKQRLQSVETDKRNVLTQLNSRLQEVEQSDQRNQDLLTKYTEAKNALVMSEAQVQEARSAETTARIRINNMEQEVALLRQQNDWLNNELKAKSDAFARYRSEKSETLTSLHSNLDRTMADLHSAQSSGNLLQKRLDEQGRKLDDVLERNRELQVQLADQEQSFKAEMRTQGQLVTLWEKGVSDAKARVQELHQELEQLQSTSQANQTQWEEDRKQYEAQLEELQTQLSAMADAHQTLQKELQEVNRYMVGEVRDAQGHLQQPGVFLSPTVAMASRLQSSGKSFTQVYSECITLQDELAEERKETQRLRECLTEIAQDVEERAAVLQEQRQEYDQVCHQASHLAEELGAMAEQKEQLSEQVREIQQTLNITQQEKGSLEQQVRDLGRQVQTLLREIDGSGMRDTANVELIVSNARSDTQRVISSELLTFRNIQELQVQNQRLLQATRELAQRVEQEEATSQQHTAEQNTATLKQAEQLITDLRKELESTKTRLQASLTERDILQRMQSQQESASALFTGPSVPTLDRGLAQVPDTPTPTRWVTNGTPDTLGEVATVPAVITRDYHRLFQDLQDEFEKYRTESSADLKRLQDQLTTTQQESSQFQVKYAKAQAQTDYLNERYQALLSNQDTHVQQLQHLRDRYSQAMQQLAVGEKATQKSQQDLIEGQEKLEQLRNQVSNFQAEKQLFKSIEGRLLQENQNLQSERTHLNTLMANLQRMQNKLEQVDADQKRHYRTQVEQLEAQLQSSRAKLHEESKLLQGMTLRREAEAQRYQNQIDQLTADHHKSRELLTTAQTSVDHLQQRVQDLGQQLQEAKDEAFRYRTQTTSSASVPSTTMAISTVTPTPTPAEDSDTVSSTHDWETLCGKLRQDLAAAQQQIPTLQRHVEQYKGISAANEAALNELSTSYEQYKQSTEGELGRVREQLARLETTVQEREKELETARQELADTKTHQEETQAKLRTEHSEALTQIDQLNRQILHLQQILQQVRRDLQQQTQLSQESQDKFKAEMNQHTQVARQLDELRSQHQAVQTELQTYRKQAEVAEANLRTSQTAWEGQRQLLDQTISDLIKRTQDLEHQNSLLHSHLETVSTQALRIRQSAPSDTGTDTMDSKSLTDTSTSLTNKTVDELREVVRFMRQDKDILQCQNELNLQENRRLKQQLEHHTRTLEETRVLLTEERQRYQEALLAPAQHADLLAKIQELNQVRESNAVLRTEAALHLNRIKSLEDALEQQCKELEPLCEQLHGVQAELDVKQAEIKALESDSQYWKDRTQQIMQRYNCVDPAEHRKVQEALQSAEERLTEATQARDQSAMNLASLQAQYEREKAEWQEQGQQQSQTDATNQQSLTEAQKEVEQLTKDRDIWKSRSEKLRGQFNNKIKDINARHNQSKSDLENTVTELRGQVEQLEAQQAVKVVDEGQASEWATKEVALRAQISQLEAERDRLAEAQSSSTAPQGTDVTNAQQLELTLAALRSEHQVLEQEKSSVETALQQARVALKAKETQVAELEQQLKAQPAALSTNGGTKLSADAGQESVELEAYKSKCAALTAEVEQLKNQVNELGAQLTSERAKVGDLEARIAAQSPAREAAETQTDTLLVSDGAAETKAASTANIDALVATEVEKYKAGLQEEFDKLKKIEDSKTNAKLSMYNGAFERIKKLRAEASLYKEALQKANPDMAQQVANSVTAGSVRPAQQPPSGTTNPPAQRPSNLRPNARPFQPGTSSAGKQSPVRPTPPQTHGRPRPHQMVGGGPRPMRPRPVGQQPRPSTTARRPPSTPQKRPREEDTIAGKAANKQANLGK
ncbi:Protein mlp1 [Dispira simplex]|nr:Protein mlp1 [Dispira simplex]